MMLRDSGNNYKYSENNQRINGHISKSVARIAIFSSMLVVIKFALSWLPNVELVTCLILVYCIIFGFFDSLCIAVVFVLLEGLLYGFALWWWIPYVLYWPLLVCLVCVFIKITRIKLDLKSPNQIRLYKVNIIATVGVVATFLFGLISTLFEVLLLVGVSENVNFFMVFGLRYSAGFPFFLMHIISNCFILFLVLPLIIKATPKNAISKNMF